MKIGELKINNIVEHKLDGIIKVTGIVDDAVGLVRCDKGNWLYIKDIGPQKINKKWLRTIGFMKLGDIAEWELPIKGIVEEVTVGVDFNEEGDVYAVCVHDDISNNMIQAEIIYMHELQNLITAVATSSSKIFSKGEVVW